VVRSREVLGAVLNAKIADSVGSDSITIYELYRIRGETPEMRFDDGLKTLRNHITVAVDQRTSVVRLTVEAPTPTTARDVAQLVLDRLSDFNLNTRQSTAGERRRFAEGRVAATERELRGAEEALRTFYDRNRQWEDSPQLRFEEQRLNRQVAVHQEVYLTMRREYELARVEEVNNTPILTVIDRPAVPGRRVRPQRTFTVLLVTVVVGVLACGLALLRQHSRELLTEQDPEYMRLRDRVRRLFSRSDSAQRPPATQP
jgi:capsule polysaccharide export protein KpsE/RkpR